MGGHQRREYGLCRDRKVTREKRAQALLGWSGKKSPEKGACALLGQDTHQIEGSMEF
jgi:hypothetical protein